MYYKFYGLKESPFNLTPNSKYFFSSSRHTEALNTLLYSVQERKGFVVITGDIGAGKTTVCRTLINKLDSHTQVALVTNSHLSAKDLLMSILEDLEVDYVPGSKAKLLSQLNDYLIEQLRTQNNVVLIVDEAQNLTPSLLEEIRMLSNLETEDQKLIQIIFIGQPELKKKLALPQLEQLRQRIAFYYELKPLDIKDAKDYIIHRLKVASDSDRKYFTDKALDLICEFSGGVPRLINQICDSALLSGYICEKEKIDENLVKEVIGESPLTQITREDINKTKKEEVPA